MICSGTAFGDLQFCLVTNGAEIISEMSNIALCMQPNHLGHIYDPGAQNLGHGHIF